MTIRYTTQQDIPELRSLWKQAFGDGDALLDSFFSVAYAPDRSLCAYEDGKTVAMVYWFDCLWREHKIAYVYAVATDLEYRKRGICGKLMESLASRLKKQDYYGILLVPATPELVGYYEKLGYAAATTMCHYDVPAAGTPDPELRQITWEQYASYRAQLLPEESVLPGEEVYRFLDTYLGFYRCAAGIFCGAVEETEEGRVLRMQEFLGEPKGMFAAITALDCRKAAVRLQGGAPFGLFCCLTKEKAMPEYFGLPMD